MTKKRNRGLRFKRTAVSVLAIAMLVPSFSGISAFDTEKNSPSALTYYVSPEGTDGNADGTEAMPYTLEEVRAKIRDLKKSDSGLPDGGITVYLKEGIYRFTESFILTEEDSGTKECPITYKNAEGETAVIEGGYVLDPGLYQTPSDEILSRNLTEDAKKHLAAYDLKAAGVEYEGYDIDTKIDSRLYIDGVRGWAGRYPNDDRNIYSYIDMNYADFSDAGGYSFTDKENRIINWAESSIENARLFGNFEIDYETSYGKILSYNADTNRVTVKPNRFMNRSARYFYYNVLEEIDVPGEYYVDTDTGMLYFYAPEGYKDKTVVFAQCDMPLIDAQVNYYTFDGLTVEGGLDTLIKLSGDFNTVQNCVLRDCGNEAINFNGRKILIFNNEIYHIGATGIYGEYTNNLNTVPSDSVVDNNLIHDFGDLSRTYNGAVCFGTVTPGHDGGYGFTVSHNEIYNCPHTAMNYLARDVIVEYNYIHDVCYEGGDAGAVYDGTWLANGFVFRHNILADVENKFNPYMAPLGYYNDNAGGGKQVYSNLFINIDGNGIGLAGQDNDIHDNILINCGKKDQSVAAIYADSRAYYYIPNSLSGWTTSAKFDVAAASSGYGGLWSWMMSNAFNPTYGTRYWSYRYPWTMLLKTTNVYDLEDKFVSYAYGDAKIRQNVMIPSYSVYTTQEVQRLMLLRDNIGISDAGKIFTDYSGGDYTVPENSVIYHSLPGFKACDAANVGRYSND